MELAFSSRESSGWVAGQGRDRVTLDVKHPSSGTCIGNGLEGNGQTKEEAYTMVQLREDKV